MSENMDFLKTKRRANLAQFFDKSLDSPEIAIGRRRGAAGTELIVEYNRPVDGDLIQRLEIIAWSTWPAME